MERTYRASNALYIYIGLLFLTGVLLGIEGFQRLRGAGPGAAVLLVLAVAWLGAAGALYVRWGRLRISISSDTIEVSGDGPPRRIRWDDVERVQEFRGPAYQLAMRDLLPGPYLPHGLVRGETVLALDVHPVTRLVFRQALVDSFGAFSQEVVRSVGREVEVDLHARWWRADDPLPHALPDQEDASEEPGHIPDFRRADVFRRRQRPPQRGRAGGAGSDR